ncbi:hypothetical protein C7379_10186 [Hallella colorans]|uniref:Uncharacterized protein n=1 Tax=Hallella colorans TaxID=1703337 RepID=A0A2U0UNV7_9BACT|nr:hypothetical protein C7379_10186 [Hallella colorans]
MYNRHIHCHYAKINVMLGKRSVKLFLCKREKERLERFVSQLT